MRVAIYARVSSDKQRDAHTVESQLRALRAYVKTQQWTIAGEYVDDGRSAKTGALDRRDGFARLLRDAESGAFQILVVFDINRLTRTGSMDERAEILGPFQRLGIDIVTPSGGRQDLRTMLGEMYVTLQALFAAEDNRKRAAAIKAGIERAAAEGRKPKGRTPFGWRYDRDTKTLTLDDEAAEIQREAFRRVIRGESCDAIAADFFARGVRSPGRAWNRNQLRLMLVSRRAVGEWIVHRTKRIAIDIPPIVDEQTWQAAQRAFGRGQRRGLRHTKHVYLLEELGLCSACGSPVHIRSDKNRAYVKYMCRARKTEWFHGPRCDAPALHVDDVDERVWATVRRELEDPALAGEIERRMAARAEQRGLHKSDANRLRTKLDRLVTVERSVLARYRSGAISDEALDAELAAIRGERADTEARLEAATERASVPQVSPVDWVRELRDLAANASPSERQRIVRAILKPGATVFDGERVRFTLLVQCRSVMDSVTRSHHETVLEIRAVA